MTLTFTKTYGDPHRALAARRNHSWLNSLDSGVRIPQLVSATDTTLTFEHLGTAQPGPADLADLADTLGRLHAAAHDQALRTANLDQAFETSDGHVIPDFLTPRRHVLDRIPPDWLHGAAALYKDANIRNFVLTPTGPAIVDFDDLTLAPFGYDLAKLLVSNAMTHGALSPQSVTACLGVYNLRTYRVLAAACHPDRLRAYMDIHEVMTSDYLGRNGYRFLYHDGNATESIGPKCARGRGR
jgi:hypothetical protein